MRLGGVTIEESEGFKAMREGVELVNEEIEIGR
jgi:hypothetical protein